MSRWTSAQNVTLAWDPNSETNLANYTLHYGVTTQNYTLRRDVTTNNTTATVSNLVAGQTYYFVVTARNVDGLESEPSNEVSYTVPGTSTNSQPIAVAAVIQTQEDQSTPVTLTGTDADGNPLTYAVVANPANGRLTGTAPALTYIPNANFFGADSFSFRVNDGRTNSAPAVISITVNPINDPPGLNAIGNLTLSEDATLQTVSLSGIASGASNETQTLAVTVTSSNPGLISSPTVAYNSPNATGSVTFAPVANASGSATLTVSVNDGQAQNNLVTRSFNVTVNPINDRPVLDALANLNLPEDAGTQNVGLTGIGSGAPDETQTLTVTATSSNPSLIPTPTVTYASPGSSGTLSFKAVTNGTGSSTITVTVNDGQSANNTFARTFTVTVTGINDAPTITGIADQTVNQNTATANLPFTVGDTETAANTLTLAGTSSNPTLVPTSAIVFGGSGASRTVRVTPALNQNGSAEITVTVSDANGGSTSEILLLTVNAVNVAPALNALSNLALNEDAGAQTVALTGISPGTTNESQSLTITSTSSNPSLIPAPSVNYTNPDPTGTLSFTPTANLSGSATITVTVNDGQAQNNLVTRSFTVTIGAVNDAPTLDPIADVQLAEDATTQTVALAGINAGAANETQPLSVTAVSSNPGLIPNPTVSYASPNAGGAISFRPLTNASGSAVITVTVNDGQAQNNLATRSFTVTVNAVNDAPTLNAIANTSINEDAGLQTVSLAGISSGAVNETQVLTFTATSSNPGLIANPTITYASPSPTGTLTFTAAAGAVGSSTITVAIDDGQPQNNLLTRSFTVTVNAVNDRPTLDPITNITLAEDAGTQDVSLTGIGTGAADENQTLTVTAVSSNPTLIPSPVVTYASPNSAGSLNFRATTNSTGSSIITVTVNDGQSANNTFSQAFTVTVTGVNDAPTITGISDQTINQNSATANLAFNIGDTETPVSSLALSGASSDPQLVPTSAIVFGGSGANRTVRVTPASNENGTAQISITVSDANGGSASDTFLLTVSAINQAPTLDALANLSLAEDAGQQTVTLGGITSGAGNEVQPITVTATSSNPSLIPAPAVNYVSPDSTGMLTFTPTADLSGSATITVTVNDGQAQNNLVTRSFTVTVTAVNDAPTLDPIADLQLAEDAATQTVTLAGIGTGATNETQPLSVTAVSSNPGLIANPSVSYASPNAGGTITFKPLTNASGSAVITVTVNDGQAQNNLAIRSFTVTVNDVNDAPTLNAIANVSINKNDGLQTVLLAGIGSGTANENQPLTVTAFSSNPTLIPDPGVSYTSPAATGSLTFAPAPDLHGTATITVTVNDGGSANNTISRSFTVTVNSANSRPTLDPIASVSILEDSQTQTLPLTGIGPGSGDDAQPLLITATSSDPGIVANPSINYTSPDSTGALSFVPVPNAAGSAVITVTVNDGQSVNNTFARSFTVTLQDINDPPTISDIADRTIVQNNSSGPIPFRILDVETSPANLMVSATSSNPSLLPVSGLVFGGSSSNRTVTISPAQNLNGSGTITITVSDSEGMIASDSFLVSVSAINVPPVINSLANRTIVEDAPPQTVVLSGISAGTATEDQPLTITATSSNPALIPAPTIDYLSPDATGTLTVQPATNASGTATITVRVDDGQSDNNAVTRSFVITVTAANDAPIISYIPNQRIEPNNSTPTIPFTISDVDSAMSSLRVTVSSSNPSLVPTANIFLTGNTSNRTVRVQPAADLTGVSVITIAVSDGALTASTVFTVTVQPGNTAPSISPVPDQTGDIYHEMQPVSFVVSDAESDPASLTVTASSFNQVLLSDTDIVVESIGAVRTLRLRPAAEKTGFATIGLTVSDGKLSTRSSFMLTVEAGTPPTDQLILQTQGNGSVSPNLHGQPLIVGKSYQITATPASGQIFAGWGGGVTSATPNLSFRMASNLVLQARFMTNPFVARKGTFNGLFHEPDDVRQHSSGMFTLALTDRGSFSGKLSLAGKSVPFRGTLGPDCTANIAIPRTGTNALSMRVEFGKNGNPEQVTGQLQDIDWIAELQGDRAVFNSLTNPAPFAGTYTLAIPGRVGDPTSPEGDSFGTLKIDGNGMATFAGSLADGTRVTQRTPLSRKGEWPVYMSLYTGKGSLLSWITITNRTSDDLTGLMSWIKPAMTAAKHYPTGFTNDTVALGSRYTPPVAGNRVLDLSTGSLLFSKGNLTVDFVNQISLGTNNKFSNLSSNKLTLTVATPTGLLTGTVIDPATGGSLRFSGVVLQKQTAAYGFLLGTNRSSQVVLFE